MTNKLLSPKFLKIISFFVFSFFLFVFLFSRSFVGISVLGFRIDNFAYITDAKTISDVEKEKIKDLDVLIINALRKEEHISHLNLEQAVEMINDLSPKKAYLTHISHHMGLHEEIESTLPENIKLAYDGLQIKLP